MERAQISLRLPTDMLDAFDKIARALDRDRSWVMLRAFSQYLDEEGSEVLREAQGLEALDRGEGVDFDQAMDEIDDIIARAEAQRLARKAG